MVCVQNYSSSRQSLHHKGDWPTDLKTTLANIELVYGHKLQREKSLWVPQIGLAVNEFTPRKSDPDDGRKLTGYSPVLGLEFNYLFRQIDYGQERTTLFYKCRLSVSPSNLMRAYTAPQFNLRMSFGFNTSPKRRRLVAIEH